MSDSEYKGYQDRISKFLNTDAAKFSYDTRFQEIDKCLSKIKPMSISPKKPSLIKPIVSSPIKSKPSPPPDLANVVWKKIS